MRKVLFAFMTILFMPLFAYAIATVTVPNMTDNEWATQSVTVIDLNASAMMVDGAIRYLSTSDTHLIPKLVNAVTYIPAPAMAEALGCYIEKDDTTGYILLRKAEKELKFERSSTVGKEYLSSSISADYYGMYINGEAYLPLRFTARFFGNTVEYSDGYIVIGASERVDNVLNIVSNFNYIKNILSQFHPSAVTGNTYYVSVNDGKDLSGDGSKDNPFKTIARVSYLVQPGDTVVLRGGTYREILTCLSDGTATNPITYKAYPGETVTISANTTVSGFAATDKENIVSASIQTKWNDLGIGRNQVFYNGEAVEEARYPNHASGEYGTMTLSPLFPTKGDIKVISKDDEAGTSVAVSDTILEQEDNYWQGGTFVSRHYGGWVLGTATIASSTDGRLDLTDLTEQWWFEVNPTYENSARYGYITGHENALDSPGEWVIKDRTMKIYLPANETPGTLSVEVKTRQLVIDLSDNQYIHLEGINTIGGGIKMNNSKMCVIQNCCFRYISHYINSMDQRQGFIEDDNPLNLNGAPVRGEMGIYDGGENNVFINNRIDFSAAAGLYLTGLYTKVENNEISNCGYMGSAVAGIYIGVDAVGSAYNSRRGGYKIYHNEIYNCGRATLCVQPYEPWNWQNRQAVYLPCDIAFNRFCNGALNTRDTGIVYFWGATMGTQLKKTQFHNNIVYMDTDSEYDLTAAIYYDNYMNMLESYDNVVFYKNTRILRDVYIQYKFSENQTNADIDSWNTVSAGRRDGISSLAPSDYPMGKPFISGIMNKNETSYDGSEYVYGASEAFLSGGVTLSSGKAVFTGSGQYIKFESIPFSSQNQKLNLYFTGDITNTGDIIDIVVGNTISTGTVYRTTISAKAPDSQRVDNISVNISSFQPRNVFIKVNDFKSISLLGISVGR